MTFELTTEDVCKLRRIILELIDQSEADGCLVCDQAGHMLAAENFDQQDPLLISALGAGVFAATRELAMLLGENEFSSVLHQGKNRSILIGAATEEILLVVLFSGDTKGGMVKLYTPTAAAAIRKVFDQASNRPATTESPEHRFVLQNTDNLFGSVNVN